MSNEVAASVDPIDRRAGIELETVHGRESAAILLMSLGEENAASVLKYMDPAEVQAIGEVMADMAPVTQDEIGRTLDGFVQKIEGHSSLNVGSRRYLQKILENALGTEQAIGVLSQLGKNSLAPALDSLKWMPHKVVAKIIGSEHPQYIAIVLSYLDQEKGAAVLEFLDEEHKTDIVLRLARLDTVHPTALREIDVILERKFSINSQVELSGAGGVKKAAEILNSISSEQEAEILEKISELDSDLADEIRDSLFVFENLLEIDGRGMQAVLREISGDLLVSALKGASEELKEKIFTNMSSRAAVLLKDDLEAKGPIRLTEVEEAQKEILATVTQLAEDGKIQLGGKDDAFV